MTKEIKITVKPPEYRDMVKFALQKSGFKITGCGYMLGDDGFGDIVADPSANNPEEFQPAVDETIALQIPPEAFPAAE